MERVRMLEIEHRVEDFDRGLEIPLCREMSRNANRIPGSPHQYRVTVVTVDMTENYIWDTYTWNSYRVQINIWASGGLLELILSFTWQTFCFLHKHRDSDVTRKAG